jgi:hypothetical protein
MTLLAGREARAQSGFILAIGTPVQARTTTDTSWREGDIVGIGPCLAVKFDGSEEPDGSYRATSFPGITGVRRVDRDGKWQSPSTEEMRALQGCSLEDAKPDPACGSGPSLARATVLGTLHGASMRAGEGGPWEPFLELGPEQVTTLSSGTACTTTLGMIEAAGTGAASDPLPLLGIVQLADLGFVVVRGVVPTAGAHGSQSVTLVGADLRPRGHLRFNF